MKKLTLSLFICIILSNCTISTQETKAGKIIYTNWDLGCSYFTISGMKYMYVSNGQLYNITKDSLECEYYKSKLK